MIAAGEEWRPVLGYEGLYEASSLGRVRSTTCVIPVNSRWGTKTIKERPGRILRPRPTDDGYLALTLSAGNVQQQVLAHQIVCAAFHGPRPPGCEVAHGDGDRANNRSTNLRWATSKENSDDLRKHGTVLLGTRNPKAKLDDEAIAQIRGWSGPMVAAARHFGVSRQTIHNVRTNKFWKHID